MSALLILKNAENIIVRRIEMAVSVTALYIIYRQPAIRGIEGKNLTREVRCGRWG